MAAAAAHERCAWRVSTAARRAITDLRRKGSPGGVGVPAACMSSVGAGGASRVADERWKEGGRLVGGCAESSATQQSNQHTAKPCHSHQTISRCSLLPGWGYIHVFT